MSDETTAPRDSQEDQEVYQDASEEENPRNGYLIRNSKVTFCRFCCSSFQPKDEDSHCKRHENYYKCEYCIKCNVCGIGVSETKENYHNLVIHASGKEHQAIVKRQANGQYCRECNTHFAVPNDHAKTGHTLIPMREVAKDYDPRNDLKEVVKDNKSLITNQRAMANKAAAIHASGVNAKQRLRVASLIFDNGAIRQQGGKTYYSSGKHCVSCIRRLTGVSDPEGLFAGLSIIGRSSRNYLCRTQDLAEKFGFQAPPCGDPVVFMVEKTITERLVCGVGASADGITEEALEGADGDDE